METMMQSAVCLLEQAAEKFKNKTVFEDKDGSISFEELRDFDTRVRKVAEENNEELKYVVETKIDGLSTALKYENGVFWL